MPLGKYYCDYCDKEFQDTPVARNRHLRGVQHQRAKALCDHSSGVCNRFVRTGSCPYGDSCKYVHPRQSLQSLDPQSVPGNVARRSTGLSLGNLPPSLQPPPEGGYPPLPFIDWGY